LPGELELAISLPVNIDT